MLTPVYTTQFQGDIKKVRKRGKNLDKFKLVAAALIKRENLDPLHYDHKLLGDFKGRRGCHIEANWLLIYKLEKGRIIFERTGTHANLFKR